MTTYISAAEATAVLSPGSTVFLQGGVGEPQALLDALALNPSASRGVHFVSVILPGVNHFNPCDFHESAKFTTFFLTPGLQDAFQSGRVQFLPIHYSRIGAYFDSLPKFDVAYIQVCPPDSAGQCNLGPVADFVPAVLARSRTMVAEINAALPAALGGHSIALDAIDFAVVADHPLPEPSRHHATEAIRRTARHVAALVRDGDSLQYGIGSIPAAILSELGNHRDLGLHSGLITEEMQPLIEAGVVNGRAKRIDRRLHIAGFALGSGPFYQWAARCDALRFCPVSYTHDLRNISALDQFVSINSALQVDLLGQVNVEMLNGRQCSGTGGALDFVRGARLSAGGRSIIALSATAANGSASRIVPQLDHRAVVSVPRSDVDYIATEFGAVKLSQLSTVQRAQALIGIAAPQFRDELARQWETLAAAARRADR